MQIRQGARQITATHGQPTSSVIYCKDLTLNYLHLQGEYSEQSDDTEGPEVQFEDNDLLSKETEVDKRGGVHK